MCWGNHGKNLECARSKCAKYEAILHVGRDIYLDLGTDVLKKINARDLKRGPEATKRHISGILGSSRPQNTLDLSSNSPSLSRTAASKFVFVPCFAGRHCDGEGFVTGPKSVSIQFSRVIKFKRRYVDSCLFRRRLKIYFRPFSSTSNLGELRSPEEVP